jgi:hypothetical protein
MSGILTDIAGVVFAGAYPIQLRFEIGLMNVPYVPRHAEDVGRRGRDKSMAAIGAAFCARDRRRILADRPFKRCLRFIGDIACAECIVFVVENIDEAARQKCERHHIVIQTNTAPPIICLGIFICGTTVTSIHMLHLLIEVMRSANFSDSKTLGFTFESTRRNRMVGAENTFSN